MRLFLFLLLLPLSLFGMTLREKLKEAQVNSYLILEDASQYTLLHLLDQENDHIILEEVSLPLKYAPQKQVGWKNWFEEGAPRHTLWLISKINLKNGCVEKIYSYTHGRFIDTHQANAFLATLLNLSFTEVGREDRRKVGLPPPQHKRDERPLWNPPLIIHGEKQKINFTAWKTRWPNDGSELARKEILIYLPEKGTYTAQFPTYFPYWIEVEGKWGSAKVRVIDSGLYARSPKNTDYQHFRRNS